MQNAMRRTLTQLENAAEAATSSSRRPEPREALPVKPHRSTPIPDIALIA